MMNGDFYFALAKALMDVMENGVLVCDSNGVIQMANTAFEKLSGYQFNELTGNEVEMLVPNSMQHYHQTERQGYQRRPVPRTMGHRAVVLMQKKNGGQQPVSITLMPVPQLDGTRDWVVANVKPRSWSELESSRSAASAITREER